MARIEKFISAITKPSIMYKLNIWKHFSHLFVLHLCTNKKSCCSKEFIKKYVWQLMCLWKVSWINQCMDHTLNTIINCPTVPTKSALSKIKIKLIFYTDPYVMFSALLLSLTHYQSLLINKIILNNCLAVQSDKTQVRPLRLLYNII